MANVVGFSQTSLSKCNSRNVRENRDYRNNDFTRTFVDGILEWLYILSIICNRDMNCFASNLDISHHCGHGDQEDDTSLSIYTMIRMFEGLNTLGSWQHSYHFADGVFRHTFLNDNKRILLSKLHPGLFLRRPIAKVPLLFQLKNRWQVITRASVDQFPWHHMASLGHIELIDTNTPISISIYQLRAHWR